MCVVRALCVVCGYMCELCAGVWCVGVAMLWVDLFVIAHLGNELLNYHIHRLSLWPHVLGLVSDTNRHSSIFDFLPAYAKEIIILCKLSLSDCFVDCQIPGFHVAVETTAFESIGHSRCI